MSMFDRFTPTIISYNSGPEFDYIDNTSDIIIGSTTTHVFKQPFLISQFASSFDVIYKQGILTTLVKHFDFRENDKDEFGLIERDGFQIYENDEKDFTIIKLKLTEEESYLFKNNCLECQVQLKFYMYDNEILYSDVCDIYVKNPLDKYGV